MISAAPSQSIFDCPHQRSAQGRTIRRYKAYIYIYIYQYRKRNDTKQKHSTATGCCSKSERAREPLSSVTSPGLRFCYSHSHLRGTNKISQVLCRKLSSVNNIISTSEVCQTPTESPRERTTILSICLRAARLDWSSSRHAYIARHPSSSAWFGGSDPQDRLTRPLVDTVVGSRTTGTIF